ncbi:MAG: hypothetical protein H6Q19_106 [Bacteroidetes bacterium]|nr:hypothetical protein [Bacteroidota bacterium]
MVKKTILILNILFIAVISFAQNIPQHISYTRIYDFVDELANDGFFELNSAVKPYSRLFITEKLLESKRYEEKLNERQKRELYFFLEDYAPEQDRLPEFEFPLIENENFRLDLYPPIFNYKDTLFRARIQPILGMNIYSNKQGRITQRWFGIDFQSMIGKNLSIYGSLRDISFSGGRLSEPSYLTNFPGFEYKEPSDFSDSRGGITYGWKWGSIGLIKDNIVWGDNYNGSNILSGRVPSFPMINFSVKPACWFEMNYIHGWLVSNVVDSSHYYVENGVKKWYRNHNKFIAANIFTLTPFRNFNFSFGNSIIYAENNVQPGYLLPVAFYKSIDHTMTKGIATENQNSQMFFNISSRNIRHLHLFSSVFIDEMKFSRFKPSSAEKNPISLKLGAKVNNFLIDNTNFTAEYTRTNIINYKHSIDVLTWASNDYNLGHYLGDNTQEIYLSAGYKPMRGLDINLSYLNAKHGNEYNYLRRENNQAVINDIISQPSPGDVIWKNQTLGLKLVYELFNNGYAVINVENSNIQGFDAQSEPITGERRMTAKEVLNYYTPVFLQGKNTTLTVGFSLGF